MIQVKALPLRKTSVKASNIRPGDYLENVDGTAWRVNSVFETEGYVHVLFGSRVKGQQEIAIPAGEKVRIRRMKRGATVE